MFLGLIIIGVIILKIIFQIWSFNLFFMRDKTKK